MVMHEMHMEHNGHGDFTDSGLRRVKPYVQFLVVLYCSMEMW
jgi:hypothetical protein